MKKNQNGFSVIELLMLLVILILLGAVGWLVYNNQNKPKTPSVSSATAQDKISTSGVVKYTNWSQIPAGLQKAILTAWGPLPARGPDDPCPLSVQSTVTSEGPVISDNDAFAITGVGCDGGAANLFVKISNSWQDVAHTQSVWDCDTIQQYNVPIALLEADNIVENAGQGNGKPAVCGQPDGSTLTLAS